MDKYHCVVLNWAFNFDTMTVERVDKPKLRFKIVAKDGVICDSSPYCHYEAFFMDDEYQSKVNDAYLSWVFERALLE